MKLFAHQQGTASKCPTTEGQTGKQTDKHTSNDEATAVRQQNVTAGLSKLGNMVWCVGVAGQVVDGSHLTLCTAIHLRTDSLSVLYTVMCSWGSGIYE